MIESGLAVVWRGQAPSPPFGDALRRVGARLLPVDAFDANDTPVVTVIVTERPVRPRRTPPSGWIWLSAVDVPDRVATEATLAGAYAVISAQDSQAPSDLAARLEELGRAEPELPPSPDLVLGSAVSRRALARASRAARTAMPVLLTGETGSGKEVMARLIHSWSPRARRRMVAINCAAIPNELMEAELFGYARGAFSGAVQRYDGQLMAAEGGTVFLDEIHETPAETQAKLLRVLEDHVVSRLGENEWHRVDFRVIAATNQNLRELVDAGLFGNDLYERLATVTIRLAPLRERLDDLPHFVALFLERFATEQNTEAMLHVSPAAMRALAAYPWPGNIRELRNVIYETLVFKRGGREVLLSDLPRRILKGSRTSHASAVDRATIARKIQAGEMNLKAEVQALQRMAIEEALTRANGNAAQAARLLGEVGRGVARDPGGTLRAMLKRMSRSSSQHPAQQRS